MLAPQTRIELERSAMVESQARIIRCGRSPQRALLPNRDAVDLGGLAADLANGIAAVGRDAVAEALFAVADCDDPL